MVIRSNKALIVMLSLILITAIGAGIWWVLQLGRPLEARQNPTVSVLQPSEEIVSRHSQFEFVFDQKMDHTAVEQALLFKPHFLYTVEWSDEGDGERLLITPANPLESNTTYHATLSTKALNQQGRPLQEPAELSLTTSREIRVIEVFPKQSTKTERVGLHEPITIRFDRSVNLPAGSQEESDIVLPQPVILDPPTPGIGQWLDNHVYSFYPTTPLNAGTEYQVIVSPMVVPGMELSDAYRWSFVTEGPRVQASFPFDGAIEVNRSSDVRLHFAQPMDADMTQASFQLNVQGEETPIAGRFVWENEQTLIFNPNQPLEVATDYEIHLTDQAIVPGGSRGLASPYRAIFTTVDYLSVESVQPAPGTVEVSLLPASLIAVQFNRPVVSLVGLAEKEELPIPITIEPAIRAEGEWVTTSLFVYRPTESLAGSTEYIVTVRDDLVDSVGSSLEEAYSWTFTTELPRVLQVEPAPSAPPKNNRGGDEGVSALQQSANGPIGLRFNQAMNKASSQAAFTLQSADGFLVAGRFEWQENGTLMQFFPNQPLTHEAEYRLVLAADVRGATGGQTNEPFEATVLIAPQLRVLESNPSPNGQDVPPRSTLFITFNTSIESKNIKQYIDIKPEPKEFFASYNDETRQLYLSFGRGLTPNTSYRITIDANLPDAYGGRLSQDYVLSFTTGTLPPRLTLANSRVGSLGTLNPAVTPIQLVDYRNISQLDFSLYRLTEAEMQNIYNKPAWPTYKANPAALVSKWSVTPEGEANESSLIQTALPLKADERNGLYFLHVTTPDHPSSRYPLEDKTILLFTPVNLTVKQTPNEIVVWATDMKSGQPRADVEIKIIDEQASANATVGSGYTDGQGLFRFPLRLEGPPNGTRSFLVKSYASDGTINGIAGPNWSADAGPWAFGYNTEWVPPQLYGTLYTERPIYRPGDTIYYKGVLREREGQGFAPTFALPTIETMEVRLEFRGEVVDSQEVTLSPFGTFHGSFTFDEEAPTGFYNLKLWQEEIGYCLPNYCFWESLDAQVQVAEYEPPTFEVTVETNVGASLADALVQGEEATATVLATFYNSGGTLADAPVRWNQFSRDYYFDVPALSGYWNWQDHESGSAPRSPFAPTPPDPLAQNGTTTLDAAGRVTLELDTDFAVETEERATPRSRRLIIEAQVTDVDQSIISGRSEMIVHAGEFYIGLRPESYLGRVERPLSFNVATANTEGILEGQHEVTLEFYQRESRSEPADFGFGWNRTFTDTLVATERATTDEKGRIIVEFTPQAGGSYTVLAIGRDSRGNEVRSRGYFWVTDSSGSVLWGQSNDNQLELTADKQEYQVGDVARILVPTNVAGMTALVSEELFEIRNISVRTLESTAEVIEIPITEEMVPNLYISVVALSGTSPEQPVPEFRMGYVKLAVSTEKKQLNLQVSRANHNTSEPPQPGETVTFRNEG